MQQNPSEDKRSDDTDVTRGQPVPETSVDGDDALSVPAGPKRCSPPGTRTWNNLIIVGGVVTAVVVLVIGALFGYQLFLSDDGPRSPGSLLALVPEDSNYVAIWNVEEVLEGNLLEALEDPDPDDWMADLSMAFGGELQLEPEYIDTYVQMLIQAGEVEIVSGQFQYDDIRDDLDDANYEESSYRGYELWSGWRSFALLEGDGFIISGNTEDSVKDVLSNLYRDGGSLENSKDLDIARLLDELDQGAVLLATNADGACTVRRCQGIGIAVNGYDIDDEVTIEYRLLFSSERAAESAADEYDQISDLFDLWLRLDIYDTEADGKFVRGIGTGNETLLHRIQ